MYKNMFLYEITHRYLKNDYQFFDTLKTKHRKIRGNCNLLIKAKFHKLEWSSPLMENLWSQKGFWLSSRRIHIFFHKKNFDKKMSLKNLKTLRKKMFKKSPASDVWAAVLQNAWALQKLQNWVYFDIFSYFQLFCLHY